MNKKIYETNLEYDENSDEYVIYFPTEIFDSIGWEKNDYLNCTVNKNGTITIERIDEE
jgi:phytoene/squalene synthetase